MDSQFPPALLILSSPGARTPDPTSAGVPFHLGLYGSRLLWTVKTEGGIVGVERDQSRMGFCYSNRSAAVTRESRSARSLTPSMCFRIIMISQRSMKPRCQRPTGRARIRVTMRVSLDPMR